jgi:hypothetical protein
MDGTANYLFTREKLKRHSTGEGGKEMVSA